MSKLLIRITIILTAIFLLSCYIFAIFGVDIWQSWYYLLFELCVCLCISKQGVYHCKFIKWTAYSIFVVEALAYIDVISNFLSAKAFLILMMSILTAGLATTTILAIRHYIKVRRLKKIWQINRLQ